MPSFIESLVVSAVINAIMRLGSAANIASLTTAVDAEVATLPSWLQAVLLPEVPALMGLLTAGLNDTADLTAIVTDALAGNTAKVVTDIHALITKVA